LYPTPNWRIDPNQANFKLKYFSHCINTIFKNY
jgi:hypothetical protein